MKVRDLMTTNVKTCNPETNLATAASLMWENDCGALPVVNNDGKVIGMITDRDICMAVGTKCRLASEIMVGEVISNEVFGCSPDDEIKQALITIQDRMVRRLPVMDSEGMLQGILSINDILLQAEEGPRKKTSGIIYEDAVGALKSICTHRTSDQSHPSSPQAATAKS